MSLQLDTRQRAMLAHMGLRLDFLPALPIATSAPAATVPAATMSTAPVVSIAPAVPVVTAMPAAQRGRADVEQADWPQLQSAVKACQACGLCQTRRQTVFGMGAEPPANAEATGIDLMIVGEAPGENEDQQGLPFVGAAGQLLDQMLAALGWSRQGQGDLSAQVYITNVLKCRPPGNRNPQPDEVAQCLPFLRRQIEVLRPRLLLAMGRFGAQALLADTVPDVHGVPLGKLRGQTHRFGEIPLVVTYHPAYLLRNPADKAKAWFDLCWARSLVPGPKMEA